MDLANWKSNPSTDIYLTLVVDPADLVKADLGIAVHIQQTIDLLEHVGQLGVAMEELQPERAVMVGDRIGDIRAGHANGIPAIAAAFGYGNDQEWAEADFRADNVEELHAQLLQWVKS